MYELNYQYCDAQAFFQIRGKSLTALGAIARMQGQYENSLDYLERAITGLRKVWAYSDLPEAYFQCALAHKEMDNFAKSKKCFDTALEMWEPLQMDAPKQIIRVRKAMT